MLEDIIFCRFLQGALICDLQAVSVNIISLARSRKGELVVEDQLRNPSLCPDRIITSAERVLELLMNVVRCNTNTHFVVTLAQKLEFHYFCERFTLLRDTVHLQKYITITLDG